MVKTISDMDDIKGLHTNCTLVGCFVSYEHEHLSDYHWIAWFMLFVLLLMCAVKPLGSQVDSLTSDQQCGILLFDECFNELLNKLWRFKWENPWNSYYVVLLWKSSFQNWWHYWLARDHWSGALLVQCDGIPSPVVPLTKVRLDIFFHVCLNGLLNKL